MLTPRVAAGIVCFFGTALACRAAEDISFRNQVLPVLTRLGCNTGACHGAREGRGGLHLSLYGDDPEADHLALTRGAAGRRVNLHAPDQSLLLLKPTLGVPHLGGRLLNRGTPLYRILRDWIALGASSPASENRTVLHVDVCPSRSSHKPGDRLSLTVHATYSDLTVEDVTTLARFRSSDEATASVDVSGKVEIKTSGEAVISARYAGKLATIPLEVPWSRPLPVDAFATMVPVNYIDEHVLAKLRRLRIPPSPACSDRAFIRRVYLDTLGILPPPGEVEAFVSSSDPGKRAKLIDALLARPEFVDLWTYKLCDLLLVSSRKLPQPMVRSYHRFIRHAVATNKPWDRMVREVLTAKGNTLQRGEGNYFVIHKEVTDLAETTASTFLGISLTCCRCHNHPLDHWTQDQYWSFASFFSRVAVVNGERDLVLTPPMSTIASRRDAIIKSVPLGETIHPRRNTSVQPMTLDGSCLPHDSRLDRREMVAQWLTSPENTRFSKGFVNRVWKHFFARGLIEPEDDLRDTNLPSNSALLDALAADFAGNGFDRKRLIQTILLSATYQRSSRTTPENCMDDRYGSHYLTRPLSAEVTLDLFSYVTDVPTPFSMCRTGVTGDVVGTQAYPPGTRALQLPDTQVVSEFLHMFGRPARAEACACERKSEPTLVQSLHLLNGETLNDKLRHPDSRPGRWAKKGTDDGGAVRQLFALALCRPPLPQEREHLEKLLGAARKRKQPSRAVFEDLFWAVLCHSECLTNH